MVLTINGIYRLAFVAETFVSCEVRTDFLSNIYKKFSFKLIFDLLVLSMASVPHPALCQWLRKLFSLGRDNQRIKQITYSIEGL
jgi:hypothetical protein